MKAFKSKAVITDIDVCPICNDEGWICEEHNDKPWPHDKCAGPGMPCKCDKGYGKPGYQK